MMRHSWGCIVSANGNKARRNIITLGSMISFSPCSSHLGYLVPAGFPTQSLTEFPMSPYFLTMATSSLFLLSTGVYPQIPELSSFSHGHRILPSNSALPQNDEPFFGSSFPKKLQDSSSESPAMQNKFNLEALNAPSLQNRLN